MNPLTEALKDKRCAYRGPTWVRKTYRMRPERARALVFRVQANLGDKRVTELITDRKIRLLRRGLMEYESKHTGILGAAHSAPYRRVAERYNVTPAVIWYLKVRIAKLAEMSKVSAFNTIRGIERDLKA